MRSCTPTENNRRLSGLGLGLGLLALQLGGGRLFVNWGSLVLAVRGGPFVLPVVADLPTLVRPESVVAWTEGLGFEEETVPELKKLLGKSEAKRYGGA